MVARRTTRRAIMPDAAQYLLGNCAGVRAGVPSLPRGSGFGGFAEFRASTLRQVVRSHRLRTLY